MSTLKVNNLQDINGANNSTPSEVANGRAKAWINFDGTGTIAIRDSFNVSSITDDATGKYTVSFTTAMSNSNYCVISSGHFYETTVTGNVREVGANVLTTTSYQLTVSYNGTDTQDAENVFSAVFGDT